jgi:hypothetical protein
MPVRLLNVVAALVLLSVVGGSAATCGDGSLDSGEECDDGTPSVEMGVPRPASLRAATSPGRGSASRSPGANREKALAPRGRATDVETSRRTLSTIDKHLFENGALRGHADVDRKTARRSVLIRRHATLLDSPKPRTGCGATVRRCGPRTPARSHGTMVRDYGSRSGLSVAEIRALSAACPA